MNLLFQRLSLNTFVTDSQNLPGTFECIMVILGHCNTRSTLRHGYNSNMASSTLRELPTTANTLISAMKNESLAFKAPSVTSSPISRSDSDTTSSSSSSSRRRRRRLRQRKIRKEMAECRQRSVIEIGYSLNCIDADDTSISSLSGYDTDYSTSDGSVGFDSPFEAPAKGKEDDSATTPLK